MDSESERLRSSAIFTIVSAMANNDASGLKEILEATVSSKFPPSNLNRCGSLLHIAAMFSGPDVVSELIKAGADVSVLNDNGETPIDVCFRADTRKVLEVAALAKKDLKNVTSSSWQSRARSARPPRQID